MADHMTQVRNGDAQNNDSYDISETQHGRLGLYRLAKKGRNVIVYDDLNYVDSILHQVNVGFSLLDDKTIGMLMPTTQDRPNIKAFNFEQIKDLSVPGPTLFATSGWSCSQEDNSQVVDSTKWAWIAAKFIGPCICHDFKQSRNDNAAKIASPEFKGREPASHVEVVLSTSYVFYLTQAFIPRTEGQTEEQFLCEQLRNIGRIRAMVPKERRDVTIFINHNPCYSCRNYVEKLEKLAGLRIRLVGSSVSGLRKKKKKTEPEFSLEEANRQVEHMISKGLFSMTGYKLWATAKQLRKRSSKYTKRKRQSIANRRKDFGSESDAVLCRGFSDSHFEVIIRDDADQISSILKDSGSESDATPDWDSDFTMRNDSDLDMDEVVHTTPRHNPYRNPFPEPVYELPAGYFY